MSKMKRQVWRDAQDPTLWRRGILQYPARIRAHSDVIEPFAAFAVQPRVEPAEWILALRKLVIVQQRDHARHGLHVGDQQGRG